MINNISSKATISSTRIQSTSSDSVLSTSDLHNKKKQVKKTPLSPPIIVCGIKDFVSVRAELIDIVGNENLSVKASKNSLKIQPSNPNAYRAIIHFLKDAEAEFHTYQMKEDKALRIVLRNLYPTTTPIEIKTVLEVSGFSVSSVTNVLSKIAKIKLPLFFVDLEPAGINNNIFELNYLLNRKIKIEEPYKQRTIVQCQNCQEYGHSKAYCSYPSRCVRCASQHLTSTCTKPRDTPAKCALCNDDHPANYRGCQIHTNL
ncbi:Pre-C2HC domain,Zinc finger, CCHC-type [Cinara cedri]|uniref:Pre-C2HC domain,Zinc finger, CCHC-type n=1 Tax=Cinara cedri TaxID=506608 RepID=A0A5E4NB96_9HEMI|nr:Pre-C2HC domain,Zinc finger, CCHC-type [Cinara cedri]